MSGPERLDPRQWLEAVRWLAHADQDLNVVETLMNHSPPLVPPAAFHCQQAAEKMAKAALVAMGAEPPKLHDIAELSELVGERMPEIGRVLQMLGGLTGWYISTRYPDVDPRFAPSEHDVRAVIVNLQELRQRINLLEPKA